MAPAGPASLRKYFLEEGLHLLPGILVGMLVIGQRQPELLTEAVRVRVREAVLRTGVAHESVIHARIFHFMLEGSDLFRLCEWIVIAVEYEHPGLDVAFFGR